MSGSNNMSSETVDVAAAAVVSAMAASVASSVEASENRLCCVCGDRSLGYNFGIITCESCKAFFRRSAVKEKTHRCLFSGNCSVTVHTRRFCPPCRLSKCLAVGMRKDMILGEEEKRRRKELVLSKKKKTFLQRVELTVKASCVNDAGEVARCEFARPSHLSSGSNSFFQQPLAMSSKSILKCHVRPGGHLQPLPSTASLSVGCRCCCHCRHDVLDCLPPALHENIGIQLSDEAIRIQRRLLGSEQEEIAILTYGYTSTLGLGAAGEMTEPWPSVSRDYFIQRTGHLVEQFVRFARLVPGFRRAPQAVQASMLKAGSLVGLMIRSAEMYDPSRGCWSVGCGGVTADKLQIIGLGEHRDYYEQHVALICHLRRLFPTDARGCGDPIVIALLQTVMLLSPEHAIGTTPGNIGNAQQSLRTSEDRHSSTELDGNQIRYVAAVSDMQLHYIALLRRHLEASYSYALSAELLPGLLRQLTICKFYARRHGRVVLNTELEVHDNNAD